jgi:hypothetical protein
MPLSVCILMHSVPGGGEVVGVLVGVGVVLGVAVGVAVGVLFGDFSVPPGVSGFDELFAGAGCGSPPGAGAAEEPGLGWGSDGGLALGLGWEPGNGAVDWLTVCVWLAEAVPAAWLPCAEPWAAGACAPFCLLRWTAYASSTGMPAGCCAGAAVRAAGRVSALVVAEAVGLAGAPDAQGFELAWRVPCTPVSIMLTAP